MMTDWRELALDKEENKDEDEEEAPVVAKIIDERPDEVKQLEVFRTGNKWKVLGATNDESQEISHSETSSESRGSRRPRHDSSDSCPVCSGCCDSPDLSPKRKSRHDSPDLSLSRNKTHTKSRRHDFSSPSPPRKTHSESVLGLRHRPPCMQ